MNDAVANAIADGHSRANAIACALRRRVECRFGGIVRQDGCAVEYVLHAADIVRYDPTPREDEINRILHEHYIRDVTHRQEGTSVTLVIDAMDIGPVATLATEPS